MARTPRGFSLLLVLLVVALTALVGSAALSVAVSDVGSATSRATRAQALTAAQAGIDVYGGIFSPSVDCPPSRGPGSSIASSDLAGLQLDASAGVDLRPRFEVEVGPVPMDDADACNVSTIGEVVDGAGHVVGRALLNGTFRMRRRTYGYTGQEGQNAQGTGTDNAGRVGISPQMGGT